MKVSKRIISLFLVILLSLTLIPTTAFAGGFWDLSAGGGGSIGTTGGGKWSAQMQGLVSLSTINPIQLFIHRLIHTILKKMERPANKARAVYFARWTELLQ